MNLRRSHCLRSRNTNNRLKISIFNWVILVFFVNFDILMTFQFQLTFELKFFKDYCSPSTPTDLRVISSTRHITLDRIRWNNIWNIIPAHALIPFLHSKILKIFIEIAKNLVIASNKQKITILSNILFIKIVYFHFQWL